ncbi:unnamed protein product [Rotaria sp. Silwood2]|nr:unnamed protein product [Rotaria sp. Silwood2]CAF3215926.1 unnamed protein product [Rotaria sp. Silwood2]CAF4510835.1 unnamed protein product [Rotaria sp. Silwood2]CAF4639572.1 unnamed protein product [Rotaria sp. Silwood2]
MMSPNCIKTSNECQYGNTWDRNSENLFSCCLCGEQVQRHQVALHACSGDNCICQQCLAMQYPCDYDGEHDDYYYENEETSPTNAYEAWE